MRTGVESEKYHALQTLLDQFRDRLDIHFIYVIEPLNTEPTDNIRNVIAGVSKYEYENLADQLVHLNMLTGDSYSPETAGKYLRAYQSGKLSFFEEISQWGDDYTGLLPLYDSKGNRVAALCVDVDIAQIHTTLRTTIMRWLGLILLLGVGFITLFFLWSERNIIKPIERLEASVVDFAAKCRHQRDPGALVIDVPPLDSGNEVETLSKAVKQMSEAMQEYLKGMLTAENAAHAAETIAELRESVSVLFDNIPGLNFSKEAKTGVYIACNQAFAEFGRKTSPAEIIGLADYDIFEPAMAEHFVRDDKKALSMDTPLVFFEDVIDAEGATRRFRTTKMKFYDPTGRMCVLGMCMDVTELERIRAENELTKAAYQQALTTSDIYENVVDALSGDYFDLYYVDVETGDYIEYGAWTEEGQRATERRGKDFFGSSRENAKRFIYEEDLAFFTAAFDKEHLLSEIRKHGAFMFNYRLMIDGVPTYVSMKATRSSGDDRHIIIGVSNVDTQVKDRLAAERAEEERKTYMRLSALNGNLIVLYYVDPETEDYTEFSASRGYEDYGIAKQGTDFFRSVSTNSLRMVHPDDHPLVLSQITRENVLSTIERDGMFALSEDIPVDTAPELEEIPIINVRKHILIADDVEMSRDMLGELLEDEYDISYAADGVETLEVLRSHRNEIDLLLLDLQMPKMTGREVIAEMQLDEDLMSVPVVFLTVDQRAELDCLKIGAMDFIPKPYPDIEIVKARIAKCIELSEDRDLIRHTERDKLTGLLNRDYFFRYVSRLDHIYRDTALDAVVCDVNQFHAVNEKYGRQFCDLVLRNMGFGIRKLARKTGGIGCRQSGDTFLLYCPHQDDYEKLLRDFMEDAFAGDEMADRISLRFGVFADARQEPDIEERFIRATIAADRVKDDPQRFCGFYEY